MSFAVWKSCMDYLERKTNTEKHARPLPGQNSEFSMGLESWERREWIWIWFISPLTNVTEWMPLCPCRPCWAAVIKVHLFAPQIFIESLRVSMQHSGCSEYISEAKAMTKGLTLVGTGYVSPWHSWQNVCRKAVKRTHDQWVEREGAGTADQECLRRRHVWPFHWNLFRKRKSNSDDF